jgi:hypothetical protein
MTMYRGSVDTLERSIRDLRAKNECLRADLATARRLASPQRLTRVACIAAWLVVLAVACAATSARASAALDLDTRDALNEVCGTKLHAQAREEARRMPGFQGRFEQRTLNGAIDRCRLLHESWWAWWDTACSSLVWTWSDESMPWDTCVCR